MWDSAYLLVDAGLSGLSGRRAHVTDINDFIRVRDATVSSQFLQRRQRCRFAGRRDVSHVSHRASSVTSQAPLPSGSQFSVVVVTDVIPASAAGLGNVSG